MLHRPRPHLAVLARMQSWWFQSVILFLLPQAEATLVSWARPLWSLIGIWLLLSLLPVAAAAESVTLVWDANTESDLAGYCVYVWDWNRKPYSKTNVGHVTTYTVSNLKPEKTYFFAVTAYDTSENESGFSNEVSATIPDPSNKTSGGGDRGEGDGRVCKK